MKQHLPVLSLLPLLPLLGGLLLGGSALAQQHGHEHGTAGDASSTSAPDASAWAEAEVRRIDQVAGKVSLKHGEIRNLDMPPMTMVFQVRDPAALEQLQAGDRVRFTADKVQGAYTVLQIEKLR